MIYRQARIGKDGKPFTMLKFRTMDDEGNITRPWLRRTGLDELPQLWNVLRGDMALFGPRPETPEWDLWYFVVIPDWYERYRVKPGILGLAQVYGTVRNGDRYHLRCKDRQIMLDVEQIERCRTLSGRLGVIAEIIFNLPAAIRRGQRSEGSKHDTSTTTVRGVPGEPSPHGTEPRSDRSALGSVHRNRTPDLLLRQDP